MKNKGVQQKQDFEKCQKGNFEGASFRIFNIAFRFLGIKTFQMTYFRPHVLSVASNTSGTQCEGGCVVLFLNISYVKLYLFYFLGHSLEEQ